MGSETAANLHVCTNDPSWVCTGSESSESARRQHVESAKAANLQSLHDGSTLGPYSSEWGLQQQRIYLVDESSDWVCNSSESSKSARRQHSGSASSESSKSARTAARWVCKAANLQRLHEWQHVGSASSEISSPHERQQTKSAKQRVLNPKVYWKLRLEGPHVTGIVIKGSVDCIWANSTLIEEFQ
jgi:hypothetical protein